jgi:hypothetical protein
MAASQKSDTVAAQLKKLDDGANPSVGLSNVPTESQWLPQVKSHPNLVERPPNRGCEGDVRVTRRGKSNQRNGIQSVFKTDQVGLKTQLSKVVASKANITAMEHYGANIGGNQRAIPIKKAKRREGGSRLKKVDQGISQVPLLSVTPTANGKVNIKGYQNWNNSQSVADILN